MTDDALTCGQTVAGGDDCCASSNGVCSGSAAWQHVEGGVALCDLHATNARLLGGVQLGYWVVGDTRVPYPDGWTSADDGRPLVVEAPQAARAAPPSGLIVGR
ncbi:MAG: hypothetical protein WD058_06635 [Dehalococcoidia bacterium]